MMVHHMLCSLFVGVLYRGMAENVNEGLFIRWTAGRSQHAKSSRKKKRYSGLAIIVHNTIDQVQYSV
jgi:hypothetical protein